jgi:superfamily II DNA or RNA helicase
MIDLRPYQDDMITAIYGAAREGMRRMAAQLPTGGGKTIVFSRLIENTVQLRGGSALVLAHRDELLQQAEDKILQVAPDLFGRIGRIGGGVASEIGADVVIGSVQTLARERRMRQLLDARSAWQENRGRPFDLVIVDEAHHAAADSYQRILTALGAYEDDGPIVIGVTATAQRADGRDLGDTFESLVYSRDMLSLMVEGYLCDLQGMALKLHGFDDSQLHTRAGDFIESEAGRALEAAEAPKHLVNMWLKNAHERKTIVFTPTVALAETTALEFLQAGVSAAMVCGETPMEQRRDMLRRFRSGALQVICNAMVLTEGFDEPSVDCIVVARPTKSKPLYVQMVGRGTRPAPGKQDCLVIDVVGVTERHDLTVLPVLFGMEISRERGEDEDDGEPLEKSILEHYQEQLAIGQVRAHRVELFNRKAMNWTEAREDRYALNAKDETVLLEMGEDGRWSVVRYPKAGEPEILREGVDQQMAMGIAEAHVRKAGGSFLIDRNAAWRQKPASPKMQEALRKWRYRGDVDMLSAGEASDLLTTIIANVKADERLGLRRRRHVPHWVRRNT